MAKVLSLGHLTELVSQVTPEALIEVGPFSQILNQFPSPSQVVTSPGAFARYAMKGPGCDTAWSDWKPTVEPA